MTISTAVKWVVSSMTGAPTLNGTAGSLIAVLDAFLVNGFGTKAVDSAVVTGGICRMAITGASAALDHAVIQLAGVTAAGAVLNGNQRVKTAAASYVEFLCDLPDGALTGTITFKIAPLGWEKVFSKTNVAVYRSADVSGTRAYYRVDDTNALYARVVMYEAMSDVDTGLRRAPSQADGYYLPKRQAAAATGVYWVLIGDSRFFCALVAPSSTTTPASPANMGARSMVFGDIESYRSGDAWGAVISGANTATYSDTSGCAFCPSDGTGLSLARLSHGIGGASVAPRFVAGNAAAVSGADGSLGAFPSRADNGLRLSPIVIMDGGVTNGPRGELPGLYHCPQTEVAGALGRSLVLTDMVLHGTQRKVLSLGVGLLSGTPTGLAFVDVTGPWR